MSGSGVAYDPSVAGYRATSPYERGGFAPAMAPSA
jgi:hypothetical protein